MINDGTVLKADNDLNVKAKNVDIVSGELTSGKDTTFVSTDIKATGETTITAGGDVNLLAAADTHETTNATSTTKTSSVGVTVGASLNYANDGASTDKEFTTGNLTVGVTQTKSKTNTTETTTTDTVYQGTTIRSDGGTTVVAANDVALENTATTGDVLKPTDTLTAGGQITEITKEDTSETVTTSTSSSTSSTKFTGPDLKQFALDSVANAVGEMGANEIGDMKAGEKNEDGTRGEDIDEGTGKVLHAVNGALAGLIRSGGDLEGAAAAAGAVGAVVGEITAEIVDDGTAKRDPKTGELNEKAKQVAYASKTAAMIAANLLGLDSDIATSAADNALQNNRLLHVDEVKRIEMLAEGDTAKEEKLLAALCLRTNCTTYEKGLSDGVTQEKAIDAYNNLRTGYASDEEMRAALNLEGKRLDEENAQNGFFAYNEYSQLRDSYIEQGDIERLKALDRRFSPYGDGFEKNTRDAEAVKRHQQAIEQNQQDYDNDKIGGLEYFANTISYAIESSGYDRDTLPAELDAEYIKLVNQSPEIAQRLADAIDTTDKIFTAAELTTLTRGLAALGKDGAQALTKNLFKKKGDQNYDDLKGGQLEDATNKLSQSDADLEAGGGSLYETLC